MVTIHLPLLFIASHQSLRTIWEPFDQLAPIFPMGVPSSNSSRDATWAVAGTLLADYSITGIPLPTSVTLQISADRWSQGIKGARIIDPADKWEVHPKKESRVFTKHTPHWIFVRRIVWTFPVRVEKLFYAVFIWGRAFLNDSWGDRSDTFHDYEQKSISSP